MWGVSFVNENFGTAVGDAGIILNTTDGGAHWNLQSSGTTKNFEKVHFSDLNNGTAVGYDSLVIRTTNGGSTWNFQITGVPLEYDFYDVFFTNANNGIILCNNGTFLKTSNGGTNWTINSTGKLYKIIRSGFFQYRYWLHGCRRWVNL